MQIWVTADWNVTETERYEIEQFFQKRGWVREDPNGGWERSSDGKVSQISYVKNEP